MDHPIPVLPARGRGVVRSGTAPLHGSRLADLLDDIEALRAWYDRAWEWVGTLEPNPTTKS